MWCVMLLLHVEQARASLTLQSGSLLCQHCIEGLTAPTAALIALSSLPFALQFYKYTAPADGIVIPWACSSGFNATLSVDDGSGDQNCIGPFNGCNDPQISNPDSQTT